MGRGGIDAGPVIVHNNRRQEQIHFVNTLFFFTDFFSKQFYNIVFDRRSGVFTSVRYVVSTIYPETVWCIIRNVSVAYAVAVTMSQCTLVPFRNTAISVIARYRVQKHSGTQARARELLEEHVCHACAAELAVPIDTAKHEVSSGAI